MCVCRTAHSRLSLLACRIEFKALDYHKHHQSSNNCMASRPLAPQNLALKSSKSLERGRRGTLGSRKAIHGSLIGLLGAMITM